MILHDISINDADLQRFCLRNRIRELSFFGSITRDDFHRDNDVDILIEVQPPDTLDMLHPYLRDRIRRGARVAYAA